MIGATGQAGAAVGVIEALAPAFAAGFAVQQLLELADPVLDKIPKDWKKPLLSLIALGIGLALAIGAHLQVLAPLGVDVDNAWDDLVTGIFISGGTQGFNSLMKFLGYAKDKKKSEAAMARPQAVTAAGKLRTGKEAERLVDEPSLDRV
jgi:hypothetical protein